MAHMIQRAIVGDPIEFDAKSTKPCCYGPSGNWRVESTRRMSKESWRHFANAAEPVELNFL